MLCPMETMWSPIEGVDLDTYARITAEILKGDVRPAGIQRFVAAYFGVPAGRWPSISARWVQRLVDHPELRAQYSQISRAPTRS